MQGQSGYTRFKEQRFEPILSQSLAISTAKSVARWPYYHVDLNSGSGFNADVGVPGSPINFLKAVERRKRTNFFAFFVDEDPKCIRELLARPELVGYERRVSTHIGDNSEILPVVAEFVAEREPNPHLAMGTILIDPNGYHSGVPWEALQKFCRVHKRFDVLVNLNTRQFRMEKWHIGLGKGKWNKPLHPLSEFPAWFTRRNWMVTEQCRIGSKNTWVQAVGRDMATADPGYSSLGFYASTSERGAAIIQEIERPSRRELAQGTNELPLLQYL